MILYCSERSNMIYIIGSCYLSHHKNECIIVKNKNHTIEEMTNIVGALGNVYFHFQKDTHRYFCPPQELFPILIEYLGCKDRKHKYKGELEFIESRLQTPMLSTAFVLRDEIIIWIDIKEAMLYTQDRISRILNTYLKKEDIEKIEMNWKQ